MSKEIQEGLLDFIAKNFFVEKGEINLDKSLVDEGIIDSMGLIEIVDYLEDEFSVDIHEDQMTRENFGSIMKIVKFVEDEIKKSELLKVVSGWYENEYQEKS